MEFRLALSDTNILRAKLLLYHDVANNIEKEFPLLSLNLHGCLILEVFFKSGYFSFT